MKDKETIERLILEYVSKGFNTNADLAQKLKMSVNQLMHFVGGLIDRHQLFSQKVGRRIIYSAAPPDLVPAHDPFGMTHGKVRTSYETPARVHRLGE